LAATKGFTEQRVGAATFKTRRSQNRVAGGKGASRATCEKRGAAGLYGCRETARLDEPELRQTDAREARLACNKIMPCNAVICWGHRTEKRDPCAGTASCASAQRGGVDVSRRTRGAARRGGRLVSSPDERAARRGRSSRAASVGGRGLVSR